MEELIKTLKNGLFLLIGFAFTLILFSTSPKINIKYKKALEAIRALSQIEYYNENKRKEFIEELLPDPILNLNKLVIDEIDKIGNVKYSKELSANQRPFDIDFFYNPLLEYENDKPDKMGDVFEYFQKDRKFIVQFPEINSFKNALRTFVKQNAEKLENSTIDAFDYWFNYANNRGKLVINYYQDNALDRFESSEFYFLRDTLSLEGISFHKWVISTYGYFNAETIHLNDVEPILDEIHNLTITEAIPYVNSKIAVAENRISFLGFSIDSKPIEYIGGLLFVFLVLYFMSYLKDLELRAKKYDLHEFSWFPLLESVYSKILTFCSILLLPMISLTIFIISFFDISKCSTWLTIIFSLVCMSLLIHSYDIIRRIRFKTTAKKS